VKKLLELNEEQTHYIIERKCVTIFLYLKAGDVMVKHSIKEIISVFLKMGFTAFGGPAAHVAIMEEEIVEKRGWVSKEDFLDMYGATNVIPGPNSTELVMHLGYVRGGLWGMIAAGVSFITPPMMMVLALAYVYVEFGTIPEVTGILYGIKPVIMAIILMALIRLWKKAIKIPFAYALVVFVVALAFLNLHEILIMGVAGLIMMMFVNFRKLRAKMSFAAPLLLTATLDTPLRTIFLNFLKIGAILYGGGYVLLVFIETDFVNRLGLITESQLLDAIAVGQLTPGPLFTTAAFIGYLLHGIPGGLVATLGIFLPSFLLVGLLHKILPYLRTNAWLGGFLDGIIVASLGLMITVLFTIYRSAIIDWYTIGIALISFGVLFRYKVNSAYLVIAGGTIGYIISVFLL
jgi:chromate transporter